MTIIELQSVLGQTIDAIRNAEGEDIKSTYIKAEYIAKIAKQMINAADVVLRTDKMCETTTRIDKIVGS